MKRFSNVIRMSLVLAALTAGALRLTGCKTIEGVGEDIQDAGDSIHDAARDASH